VTAIEAAPNLQGILMIVLHAHLPYVRHPEHDRFLEEDWLFEAITETYVPLVAMFDRLLADGIDFRITMSATPPLCEMLADDLLRGRYVRRIETLIELAGKEVSLKTGTPFEKAARMYHSHFHMCRDVFANRYGGRLCDAFRKFQDAGVVELVTCPATHAYLPLMRTDNAVRAQLRVARANYRKHFHRDPRGVWLSECASFPGLDSFLSDEGLGFFFVDSHALFFARPRPRFGIYAPVYTPSGVAAFARDIESSKQVWSSVEGYPGDPAYREFYRDLGYDAPYDFIRPYLHPDGVRRSIAVKYHRVTGDVELKDKAPYDPDVACETAAFHAGNFLDNRRQQARHLKELLGRPPVLVAPYDAELFGHWWFEGPMFLEYLIRKIACDQDEIRLATQSEHLRENPALQVVTPSASSWGDKGYNEVWLNGSNDWIYPHLHAAEERMVELTRRHAGPDTLTERALNQAARELMLAQSSDWAFIMTTGTSPNYAQKRTRDHLARFRELCDALEAQSIDTTRLAALENQDPIFQEMDYRVFA